VGRQRGSTAWRTEGYGGKLDDPVARREIRHWLRGSVKETPFWIVLLALAQGDPLRAQQMEEDLNEEWLTYGIIYMSERNAHQERENKRRGRNTGNHRKR
jgi:hypothetical protein